MLPFRLSIFLLPFIAVAALAQAVPGSAGAPRPVPAKAASVFDAATVTPGVRQWKFAVVSIRKNSSGGPMHIGIPTADGYRMTNLFLWYLIRMAYRPQNGAPYYFSSQLIGMPAWLTGDDDRYDVNAKVDEADLADWQNPTKQPLMQRAMLQAMLEDRLGLVVHRSSKQAQVDLLVVGKNGPKFKETNPNELRPGARPMPGGGALSREENDDQMTIHSFGISIAQLASFVLGTGHPVQDETGLVGRYDITMQRPVPQPGAQQAGTSASDVEPSAAFLAQQLGLRLEPSRGQVETLVIDHVERPTPN